MVDDRTREEKRRQYRKAYWQRFREDGKRRIYGTLTKQEHRDITALAKQNGRSVFAQIWAQSCAYRNQRFVPSKAIEKQIATLYIAIHRIGNNVNQVARETNGWGRLRRPAELMKQLAQLEASVEEFVSRPWKAEDDS